MIIALIFKDASKLLPKQYRPISFLNIILCIFDKCLYTKLNNFIEEHNLISAIQWGGRKSPNPLGLVFQLMSKAAEKFKWKKNGPHWTKAEYFGNPSGSLADVGIIAQEIQEVLPEAVRKRRDGHLAVDYTKIIPLLIEGIKDQQKQIDELQTRIEKLESV